MINWRELSISLFDSFGLVLGVLLGTIIGVLLCIANTMALHPVLTNFWRYFYGDGFKTYQDNLTKTDGPKFEYGQPAFALVLSDLHVDTWEDTDADDRGETMLLRRTRYLENLLEWGYQRTDRLILNGDLLDAPPHPNNQGDPMFLTIPYKWPVEPVATAENRLDETSKEYVTPGILQHRFLKPLQALHSFGKPTISSIGNHDMGINGLRMLLPSGNGANWVPGLMFEAEENDSKRVIFMEHGHLHDPILWVYIAYSLIDLLVRGDNASGGQRGGRVGKTGHSATRDQVAPTLAAEANTYQHRKPIGWGATLARFSYRMAAYRRLRELRVRFRRENLNVTAILMGHTHIPDRYQLTKDTVYVNLGDWAGNTEHQTFTVIRKDGVVVGPIEWG